MQVSARVRGQTTTLLAVIMTEATAGFLREAVPSGVINVIANERDEQEYRAKWQEEREVNRIPGDEPTVFLEVSVADASESRPTWRPGARSGSATRY